MKQLGVVLVFGVGLGVGCAAGTAVQTHVAEAQVDGEASAPAGTNRWTIECVGTANKARELAAEGWEPYAVDLGNHCLRRPLP